MTENFEVSIRSSKDWEMAILKSYKLFRSLIANGGGEVQFDAFEKKISYLSLPKNSVLNNNID